MASKTLPWRGPLFLLSKRKWVITSWVCFLANNNSLCLSLSTLHLQRWKEQTLTCEFERLPLLVRSGFRADRSNLAWETSELFIESLTLLGASMPQLVLYENCGKSPLILDNACIWCFLSDRFFNNFRDFCRNLPFFSVSINCGNVRVYRK